MNLQKERGNGYVAYRLNGKLHREGGPAVEWDNGHEEWYMNGKLHREGGPALDTAGSLNWYLYGKLNREGGPAIEYANGDRAWYSNGKLHRVNGPALEYSDGNCRFFLDGVELKKTEYRIKMVEINLMNLMANIE